MRLISLHIENFGRLHDENMSFASGINSFLRENGWGKSTTVAFIKAMLYGFDKKDREERLYYKPWQGGSYGGYITIEFNGKQYRIVRSFGDTPAKDTLEVRDEITNMPTDALGKNPGENIFGVGSESFMRTVFIRQNQCGVCSTTDEMNAKMGNITDGVDLNKYKTADEALNNLENRLEIRKNSESGRIKEEATSVLDRIHRNSGVEAQIGLIERQLTADRDALTDTEHSIKDKEKQLDIATKNEALLSDKDSYNRLFEEVRDRKDKMDEAGGFFAVCVPTSSEVDTLKTLSGDYALTLERLKDKALSTGEMERLATLQKCFFERVPEESEILSKLQEAQDLDNGRRNASVSGLSVTEEERLASYGEIWGSPSEAKKIISGISTDWSRRTEQEATLTKLETNIENRKERLEAQKRRDRNTLIIAGVIAMLLVVAGGIMFAFPGVGTSITPVICIGIGVIIFVAVLFNKLLKSGPEKEAYGKLADLELQMSECRENINAIDSEVSKTLSCCNKDFDVARMQAVLQELYSEAMDYQQLLGRKSDNNPEVSAALDRLSAEISTFLRSFGFLSTEKEYISKLNELYNNRRDYSLLTDKAGAVADLSRKKADLESTLTERLYAFVGVINGSITEIVSLCVENHIIYSNAKMLYEDLYNRMQNFEAEHDMDAINAAVPLSISVEEVKRELATLREKKEELRSRSERDMQDLEAAQEKLSELNDDRDTYDRLKAELAERAKRLDYVKRTRELLARAKENLIAKYTGPLMSSFSKYYGILTGSEANTFRMNAATELEFEEQGMDREVDSLSSGYRDLVGLCNRLAMADAMFTGERPMLVLDDPFVNLDDTNLSGAKKLVEEVSKDYQILYFTCTQDRNVHFS